MKKIHALALVAMLALSMNAFAADAPKGASCDKKESTCCKVKDGSTTKETCCKDAAKCEKHEGDHAKCEKKSDCKTSC